MTGRRALAARSLRLAVFGEHAVRLPKAVQLRRALVLATIISICFAHRPVSAALPAIDAYNIGRYHANAGDYTAAVRSFSEALMMNPRYAIAYVARAKAYNKLGQGKLALGDLEAAIKYLPKYPELYITRAQAHASLGEHGSALEDLNLALDLDTKNPQAWFQRSNVHAALGQLTESGADLTEALKLDPFIETRNQNLQTKAPRVASAPASAQPITASQPAAVTALPRPISPAVSMPFVPTASPTAIAPPAVPSSEHTVVIPRSGPAVMPHVTSLASEQMSLVRQHTPELLPSAAPAPESSPVETKTPDSPVSTPDAVTSPSTTDEPLTTITPSAEANKPPVDEQAESIRKRLERARHLVSTNDFAAACAELTVALAFDPQLTEARLERGRAYLKAGRPQSALEDLDAVVAAQPTAAVHYDRGCAYMALNRLEEAYRDFEEAVLLDDTLMGAQAAKAETARLIEMTHPKPKSSPALEAVASSAQGAPSLSASPVAPGLIPVETETKQKVEPARDYFDRGKADLEANQLQRAVANLGVALRLRPDYPEAMAARGKALVGLGRWREAAADLDVALEEFPGAADLYCARVRASIGMHDLIAANDDLQIALRLDPASAEAARLKADLAALSPPSSETAEGTAPEAAAPAITATPVLSKPSLRQPSHGHAAIISDDDVFLPPPTLAGMPATEMKRPTPIMVSDDAATESPAPPAPVRTPMVSDTPAFVDNPLREARKATAAPAVELTPPVEAAPSDQIDTTQPTDSGSNSRGHIEVPRLTPPLEYPAPAATPSAAPPSEAAPPAPSAPLAASSIESETADESDLHERAAAYLEENRYDEAIEILNQAIARSPRDPSALIARADAFASRARLVEAAADYSAALAIDPTSVDALVGRGLSALYAGGSEAAAIDFTDALRLNPNHARAHYGLGKAHRQLGNYAQAIEHLSEAVILDPHLTAAQTELARARKAME
jgi:tetratricopeptide (TPR) repeat protein